MLFYNEDLPEKYRYMFITEALKGGEVVEVKSGMCGDVYMIDRGECVIPRCMAIKLPKPRRDPKDSVADFLREQKLHHNLSRHPFINSAFDYYSILEAPAVAYRMWKGDITSIIDDQSFSTEGRLAFIAYLCTALEHCYSNGIVTHQDLKPQNILFRDYRTDFRGLPDEDVFRIPKLADFGLANLAKDKGIFDGARPYMAPEQWNKSSLSNRTDIFALGIIMFELLTHGHHPIGGITQDWWPIPVSGNGKAWLSERKWKKWVKNGIPITEVEFICTDMTEIVYSCLNERPQNRPSCNEIREVALNSLGVISKNARIQAEVQISTATEQVLTVDQDTWPYLHKKFSQFVKDFE